MKNILIKAAVLAVVGLAAVSQAKAQVLPKGYFHVDWQLNVPLSNGWADKTSGWGMNFEGGYYVAGDWAVGGFLAYHTNNEYIPSKTIALSSESAITTDQQHCLFQLPFGVTGRYRFINTGVLEPYGAMKLGANFARFTTFYSAAETYDNTWGFYLSPEIGLNIYPSPSHLFGFHVAAYFSYGTNSTDIFAYDISGLSNFGVRVGVTF